MLELQRTADAFRGCLRVAALSRWLQSLGRDRSLVASSSICSTIDDIYIYIYTQQAHWDKARLLERLRSHSAAKAR
jgi:hypothetical protein